MLHSDLIAHLKEFLCHCHHLHRLVAAVSRIVCHYGTTFSKLHWKLAIKWVMLLFFHSIADLSALHYLTNVSLLL